MNNIPQGYVNATKNISYEQQLKEQNMSTIFFLSFCQRYTRFHLSTQMMFKLLKTKAADFNDKQDKF
jgi:hypothetical protein